MWYLTEMKNGEVIKVTQFNYVDIERAVKLYQAVGYKIDPVFTEPDWGRYYLDRNTHGEQESVILEMEED